MPLVNRSQRKGMDFKYGSYFQKKVFTDLINGYRAAVANMNIKILHEFAADMKVVNWDEELQVFAVYSSIYMSMHSPKFCYKTIKYPNVTRIRYYFDDTNDLAAENLMEIFHKKIVETIGNRVNFKNKRVERFSVYVDSKFEAIGCAFASYESTISNNTRTYLIECYLNQATNRDLNDVFIPGPTCNLCDCIEICSKDFDGLCEYRQQRGVDIYCMDMPVTKINTSNVRYFCETNSNILGLFPHVYIVYSLVFSSAICYIIFIVYYKHLK